MLMERFGAVKCIISQEEIDDKWESEAEDRMRRCGISAAPGYVARTLETLWAAGYEAYPVGGCVRDVLMGKTPQDWDICTDARPGETEAVFAGKRIIETGLKHGTVTVLAEGNPLEITTFRTESGYGDLRHPDRVEFVRTLEEDLKRRDFTINAMAFGPDGSVIDRFGGQADLAAGRIRCVGAPEDRFREDALRILRALRFSARLDFSVEAATAAAVHGERALLRAISPERCFSEMKGILTSVGAGRILREFADVFFVLMPELEASRGFRQNSPYHIHDVWTHVTMAVDAAPPEPVMRLSMLLHDAAKPAKYFTDGAGTGHFYGHAAAGAAMADGILRRLRCDNGTREAVTGLIAVHDTPPPQTRKGTRRLLTKLGEPAFRRLIACWKADSADRAAAVRERNTALIAVTEGFLEEILRTESCFSLGDLAVNGADLRAAGIAPGPGMGAVLRELFRLVTEEGVPNERKTLLEAAKKMGDISNN